jgi:hypothetical protein
MRIKELSIAIPYHGDRIKWVTQTILNIHNMNFIKEFVLTVDPCDDFNVNRLRKALAFYPKVKIIENEKRLFVFRNKVNAVKNCKCDWVALIDSDNIIGATFLGPILNSITSEKIMYAPEIGFPSLHYEKYANKSIGFVEATKLIGDPTYDMLINTMNYMVHKDTWLLALEEVIESEYEPVSADSAWINYNCMKAGMTLMVVRGCTYKHTIHSQSTYHLYSGEGVKQYAHICKLMKDEVKIEDFNDTREIQAKKQGSVSSAPDLSAARRPSGAVLPKEFSEDTNRFNLLSD